MPRYKAAEFSTNKPTDCPSNRQPPKRLVKSYKKDEDGKKVPVKGWVCPHACKPGKVRSEKGRCIKKTKVATPVVSKPKKTKVATPVVSEPKKTRVWTPPFVDTTSPVIRVPIPPKKKTTGQLSEAERDKVLDYYHDHNLTKNQIKYAIINRVIPEVEKNGKKLNVFIRDYKKGLEFLKSKKLEQAIVKPESTAVIMNLKKAGYKENRWVLVLIYHQPKKQKKVIEVFDPRGKERRLDKIKSAVADSVKKILGDSTKVSHIKTRISALSKDYHPRFCGRRGKSDHEDACDLLILIYLRDRVGTDTSKQGLYNYFRDAGTYKNRYRFNLFN